MVAKLDDNPEWRGERQAGSGRPRVTTKKLDRKVIQQVFTKRGKKKVTVNHLRTQSENDFSS